ncbi:MAG: hypothetical protein NTY48_07580, partial [Candidatus Diapherotrites archaeon]|nr:hypothetical protein [Candidatus Diapherotrites archaeon]
GIGSTTKLSRLTVTNSANVTNIGGTTTANNTKTITGVGTSFLSLGIGDRISLSSDPTTYSYITAIASDTSLTVADNLGNGTSQTINKKPSIFRLDNSSNVRKFLVNDQGNVEIYGTHISGKGVLYVEGDAQGYIQVNAPTTGYSGFDIQAGGASKWELVAVPTTSDFKIIDDTASSAARMTIVSGTGATGGNIGLGTTSPPAKLSLYAVQPSFMTETSGATIPSYASVGFSPALTTKTNFVFTQAASNDGGVQFLGFSGTANATGAIYMYGHMGVASPSYPAITLGGYKTNGAGNRTALAAAEQVLQIANGATNLVTVQGNGNVGIGTTTPTTKLDVNGNINVDSNYMAGGVNGYTGDCNILVTPIIHVKGGIITGCS